MTRLIAYAALASNALVSFPTRRSSDLEAGILTRFPWRNGGGNFGPSFHRRDAETLRKRREKRTGKTASRNGARSEWMTDEARGGSKERRGVGRGSLLFFSASPRQFFGTDA